MVLLVHCMYMYMSLAFAVVVIAVSLFLPQMWCSARVNSIPRSKDSTFIAVFDPSSHKKKLEFTNLDSRVTLILPVDRTVSSHWREREGRKGGRKGGRERKRERREGGGRGQGEGGKGVGEGMN